MLHWEFKTILLLKSKFYCCEPKWPQVDHWPLNIGLNVSYWSTCISLMVMLCCIDELQHFLWKITFDPSDLEWPHHVSGGSQADKHVCSCYVTWTNYSIFSKNDLYISSVKMTFDPSDPKWPQIEIFPKSICYCFY